MAETNGEFPTVIGADATFKGELSFEKGVRIEGAFEGQISSKGTLDVAEGARVRADVEAANMQVEGECKGNIVISEKLHLMATAKMEGDLRANRLEIADGAIFVGNVAVGQAATDAAKRTSSGPQPQTATASVQGAPKPRPPQGQPGDPNAPRPRPQEVRVPTNP